MAGKNTAAFGIFRDRESTENAVQALKEKGFRNTDVSVLFPENWGNKDFAVQKATKAPEGATTGAGSGALVGGALGWLAGIGALAIPGFGPLLAAGPIIAALAGAGVGGTIGALSGALIGMGIPEYEARRYEGRVKAGGILLSVHCDDSAWTKRAKQILENTGAEDVSSTAEAAADYEKSDRPLPRNRALAAVDPDLPIGAANPNSVAFITEGSSRASIPPKSASSLITNRQGEDMTAKTNDDTIDVVQGLIETCRDGEEGFRQAADNVKDPELARFFRERSTERSTFARELESEAQRLGKSDPKERGTVAGAMHRSWIGLKEKLGAGDHSILESVEQGEDAAKKKYQDALNADLSPETRTIVNRQASAVLAAHDRVKLLRDTRRAA